MIGPIVLIRHAHPEDRQEGAASHWTDTRLSDRGRREAQCLAERLAKEIAGRPCSVIASDLKRARETAEIICARLNLAPPRLERAIREFNNGVGGTLDAILAAAHRAALAALEHPDEAAGESWAQFHNRVSTAMDRVLQEKSALTLVVSHYGTIINTVQWWLGIPLNAALDTPVGFNANLASITILQTDSRNKHVLERLNDTAHLHAANIAPPLFPQNP